MAMDHKEHVENARAYLAAKQKLTYAENELEQAAERSYPEYDSESRALVWPLRDIVEAREIMNECLSKV